MITPLQPREAYIHNQSKNKQLSTNWKSDITNTLDIVLSCLEEFSYFFENSLKAGLNITKVTRHLDSLK